MRERMRTTYVAAAVIAAIVCGSVASAQNAPADLAKAREERTAALAKGDCAAFDRLTADNFIVIDAQGRVENKQERAARLAPQGAAPNPPSGRMNEKVSVYNNDTAVVTWSQQAQGTTIHFMETWVRDQGQWKCAAANINRPQPPGGGARGGERGRGGQ